MGDEKAQEMNSLNDLESFDGKKSERYSIVTGSCSVTSDMEHDGRRCVKTGRALVRCRLPHGDVDVSLFMVSVGNETMEMELGTASRSVVCTMIPNGDTRGATVVVLRSGVNAPVTAEYLYEKATPLFRRALAEPMAEALTMLLLRQ